MHKHNNDDKHMGLFLNVGLDREIFLVRKFGSKAEFKGIASIILHFEETKL